MAQPFDPISGTLSSSPTTIVEQVAGSSAGYGSFSVSATGVLAYSSGFLPATELRWVDRAGKATDPVAPVGDYVDLRLSPEESRLAFSRTDPRNQAPDVWVRDLTRGTEARVASDTLTDSAPLWSPSGDQLIFRSNRGNGIVELYQTPPIAGTEVVTIYSMEQVRLTHGAFPSNLWPTDWSPDGRFIIYQVSVGGTGIDIWALPLIGERKPVPIASAQHNEIQGYVSPNSRWLAYASDESGRYEIYVQSFPDASTGGKITISSGGGTQPRWSRNGRELFYLRADGTLMAVAVKTQPTFESTTVTPLFKTPLPATMNTYRMDYVPAADGQRFLMKVPVENTSPSLDHRRSQLALAHQEMTLIPGARLGPYEILAAIGAGGMGEVYKARDTRLDRIVAVKVLPETLAADPQFRARFELRGARHLAAGPSEHLHAARRRRGATATAFLVMEYLEGETLADRIARGRCRSPRRCRSRMQIAGALDRAHRAGIVHRDLKPGNIILTKVGAKLLDFGLAKQLGEPCRRNALGIADDAARRHHGAGRHPRHVPVHGAGTDRRARRRRAHRHLRVRRRALRDAHRQAGVRGQEPGDADRHRSWRRSRAPLSVRHAVNAAARSIAWCAHAWPRIRTIGYQSAHDVSWRCSLSAISARHVAPLPVVRSRRWKWLAAGAAAAVAAATAAIDHVAMRRREAALPMRFALAAASTEIFGRDRRH